MTTKVLCKTMYHFFPQFLNWLGGIKDPRVKKKITYPIENLVYVGMLLFLTKVGAKRQIKFRFNVKEFVTNLNTLTDTELERIADYGTLDNLLEKVNPDELSKIPAKMVNELIRKKVLTPYRLFGHYMIAIDGTGHLVFDEQHCEHCLTKKREKDGKILYYYHPVVDAKLITQNGLSLSIATEFIENTDGYKKQDCELNAAKRLFKKIKKRFPQLKICLLLDSLYPGLPVFDICKEYGWKYMITFKEGSMKDVFGEYTALKELSPENTGYYKKGRLTQDYSWVNEIDYNNHKLNVLECSETKPGNKGKLETTKYVWLTNFIPDKSNYKPMAEGGRLRWKIENEGYNMQKNGGYNLEHGYSYHPVAMKNYYILLQISHIVNQLMEKGSLLKDQIKTVFGSIRNVAHQLLEDLRTKVLTKDERTNLLSTPFQIRFDTS